MRKHVRIILSLVVIAATGIALMSGYMATELIQTQETALGSGVLAAAIALCWLWCSSSASEGDWLLNELGIVLLGIVLLGIALIISAVATVRTFQKRHAPPAIATLLEIKNQAQANPLLAKLIPSHINSEYQAQTLLEAFDDAASSMRLEHTTRRRQQVYQAIQQMRREG